MLIFGVLIVLTVISILIWKNASYSSDWDILGIMGVFIFGTLLVVGLIILPINYYSGLAEIERYHALKNSIEESRKDNMSEVERAALVNKIAEYNADIASTRYWNNTVFDIFIPDELAELEDLN